MGGFALNGGVSEEARAPTLLGPIAGDELNRNVAGLRPGLKGVGGIAFCGQDQRIGDTPRLEHGADDLGLEVLKPYIAPYSENTEH